MTRIYILCDGKFVEQDPVSAGIANSQTKEQLRNASVPLRAVIKVL